MRLLTALLIVWSIAGRVAAQPNLVPSADTLNFGTVVLHDSRSMFFSIKNTGTAPINYIGAAGPVTADFTLTNAGAKSPLDPDSISGFSVKFSPQSITGTHLHRDSIHFKFAGGLDVVVQLVGYDHAPISDTVSIDDTFLGYAGQTILIPQRITHALTGELDSVNNFGEWLDYDPQVMTLEHVYPGACLPGWSVNSFEPQLGHPIIRANANGTAMLAPGVLLMFEFRFQPDVATFQWTSIIQDSIQFGAGFEPLVSSLPGKVTVIDSCTSVTTTLLGPGSMISPNVPNPFESETVFTYQVGPSTSGNAVHVRLGMYDARGALAACLVDGDISAGTYSVSLPRGTLAAGVYSCVYEAGSYRSVRRVVVLP